MKNFIRFLITVFLLVIVCVTIYFCINTDKESNKEEQPNNYPIDSEIVKDEESLEKDLEKTLVEINAIMEKTLGVEDVRQIRTVFTKGILGTEIDEYIDSFEIEGISATVHIVNIPEGKSIAVIPDVDFLKNQEFLYNENGELLLYNSVSNTVEGAIHYYFSDGVLLEAADYYEEGITPVFENETDILVKASNIYKMFEN